jgi:protease I
MPQQQLTGKKIAILVENGFEQVEMTEPRKALEAAGATTHLISPQAGHVQGWNHHDLGDQFPVDVPLAEASVDEYDGLLLPGGVVNPDQLRMNVQAVQLVRLFFENGKPIAAICHGPWTLIEADVVRGQTITSWPSLKTDLRNAGAMWVDQEVVTDGRLVTSRNPDDIPAFNRTMIDVFAAGSRDQERAV